MADPGSRFHALVILQCVRSYCKYTISYRQLEEMMAAAAALKP
jgi:transposase-like protein